MKAAIEVVVVLFPLSINRMFLNSSVKRGNSPEGKTQTLTLHLEKTMPIMAKISGKFPVSFCKLPIFHADDHRFTAPNATPLDHAL